VRTLSRLPDALFVVDVQREATAIHEANLLNIPVVAMVDTNCDPKNIDYIIPSNDDAIRAIKLIVAKIADAVAEGKAMRKDEVVEEPVRVDMMEEAELTDEELLGEATLAKLSQTRTITVDENFEFEAVAEELAIEEAETETEEVAAEEASEAESPVDAEEASGAESPVDAESASE
jgi:small subunit ribosomal protein S2